MADRPRSARMPLGRTPVGREVMGRGVAAVLLAVLVALALQLPLRGTALAQGNPFLGGSPKQDTPAPADSAQGHQTQADQSQDNQGQDNRNQDDPAQPDQSRQGQPDPTQPGQVSNPAAPTQADPTQADPTQTKPTPIGKTQPGQAANQAALDQDNPDQAAPQLSQPQLSSPQRAAPSWISRAKAWLAAMQRDLNRTLSGAIRDFEDNGGLGRILALLGTAFLYGLLHALGPGHGKSVASAYFLSRGGRVRQGLFMGLATGLTHALSAVAVVFSVYFLLRGSLTSGFENASARITSISFACVALLGLWLTIHSLREALRPKTGTQPQAAAPRGHYLKAALVSGIIPCPGAALILFFTLALDAPLLGLASVAAMSLGMGLTISAAAVLTVCCRSAVLKASSARPGLVRVLGGALSVAGSLAVLLLGLLLFWASL